MILFCHISRVVKFIEPSRGLRETGLESYCYRVLLFGREELLEIGSGYGCTSL